MKELVIEWRHLIKDGKTCNRCENTGIEIQKAIATLKKDIGNDNWEIIFKETAITDIQLHESNAILINNIPIEKILPKAQKSKNHCDSCGEILGTPAFCRTIEYKNQIFETIPASLIRDAVIMYINQYKP